VAPRRKLIPAWIALVLLFALCGAYLVHHTWWDSEDVNTVKAGVDSGAGFEGTDEYDPLGDDHTDIPKDQPEAKLISEQEIDPAPKPDLRVLRWTAEDHIVVVRTRRPALVGLRLLHHPAWAVSLNGKPAKTSRTNSYDAIVVPVLAGESRIEARFTRTPDRTIGGWISIASLLLSGLLAGWPFRQTKTNN
jgi:hypothetical protein